MKLSDLHAVSPYLDFPLSQYPQKIRGWNYEDEVFDRLITEVRPRLILEVGTWLGGSALKMAESAQQGGLGCPIVCVDTWLGALEMWTDQTDPERYGTLGLRNGYPTLYHQFLANVIHSGAQDQIIPFPQASRIAARWFRQRGIHFDLTYIDGSHDYPDVMADLEDYSQLSETMFGDDYHTWADVRRAVDEFTKYRQSDRRNLEVTPSGKWIIRRK